MTLIEVADLDPIAEQDPIAMPVEPVGQEYSAGGADGNTGYLAD